MGFFVENVGMCKMHLATLYSSCICVYFSYFSISFLLRKKFYFNLIIHLLGFLYLQGRWVGINNL